MKTYFIAIMMMVFPCLLHSQDQNAPVRLKQINIVKTNYQNSKDGEIVNKTVVFKDGKIETITTSDVVQHFFYNTKGLLDKTVKDKIGSEWKEVVNYSYDADNNITKFVKKYQEGNDYITKTVTFGYEGARVKVITKKSTNHQNVVDDNEYIVENGIIVRRTTRDRNKAIIGKIEYVYVNDNVVKHKGLVGDKISKTYTFDDKKSVDQLIVQSLFGDNYKVIVPMISYHEEEFSFEAISYNNEMNFSPSSTVLVGVSRKYKYNKLNFPISCSQIEENGIVKTEKTFIYE
ncbi:hypothetical protein B0A79_21130 [Flavobacterium piscis]|uniref:DUF4595 domain-containing protein n=1 Tax=Flavobacterium piscis TaxID=1114874 RepID=A0ABX2XCK5_9FLAO|nr:MULTISPECIES: hypothetical protein [Flavobacterium]OCB69365.1 hypothetical protein FLP_21990 [Flavobacterium piscis]OXE98065.1 hypothetical protein B0A79_21130 [Flavobacterium piscis]QDW19663.1 hypothetical protein B0M43_0005900 [Flavobacterium sp. KBS0721]